MWDVAAAAGLGAYYDRYYRLYCRFTHATFGAITGALNAFDPEDNRTIAVCALSGLETVLAAGGVAPNIDGLRSRLSKLG